MLPFGANKIADTYVCNGASSIIDIFIIVNRAAS
jgi:hypothetical protein